MIWYKKIFFGFLVILLLGSNPIFMANESNVFFSASPISAADPETFPTLSYEDISENNEKILVYFINSFTDSINGFFIIFFCLPITFYIIKQLSKSRIKTRLPTFR